MNGIIGILELKKMFIFSKIILTGTNARLLNSLEAEILKSGSHRWTWKKFLAQSLYKLLCMLAIFCREDL